MSSREGFRGVDLLLTAEWPRGVATHVAPPPDWLNEEGGARGCEVVARLAALVRPRYHFVGGLRQFYERTPYRCVVYSDSFTTQTLIYVVDRGMYICMLGLCTKTSLLLLSNFTHNKQTTHTASPTNSGRLWKLTVGVLCTVIHSQSL